MEGKIKLSCPVIVEGRYDKQRICQVAEGTVITLDGFSVFNNKEKIALLRRLCESGNIIILTDSDKAGAFIRARLKEYLPSEKLINLYVPRIEGKEKRKKAPSKDGVLGVEGIDAEIIRRVLSPFADGNVKKGGITKAKLYGDGLSGKQESGKRRDTLAALLGLPSGMTPKAFLEALNILCTSDEYEELISQL